MIISKIAKGIRYAGLIAIVAWGIFVLQGAIISHVAPYGKPHDPFVSVSTVSNPRLFPSFAHVLAFVRSQVIYILTVVKLG